MRLHPLAVKCRLCGFTIFEANGADAFDECVAPLCLGD